MPSRWSVRAALEAALFDVKMNDLGPEEPSAYDLLAPTWDHTSAAFRAPGAWDAYNRLVHQRQRVAARTPDICATCGAAFSRDPLRPGLRRCPACRSNRRGRSHA